VLATRIIPTILSKNGRLVKGEGFKCDRVVGNALQAARIHAMRGVDEIMLLDVTATKEGREPDYKMVKKLSDKNFSPLTVGGGIKTEEHVRKLLRAGADKICIGYHSYPWIGRKERDIREIRSLSDKFGRQCITISMDVYGGNKLRDYRHQTVRFIDGWAERLEASGAGEILLQSVERDGTMKGYDLGLIKRVSEAVNIPVIASGGCSGYEDAFNAIQAGASAVAVGALFQFTEATPKGMAQYLKEKGVEVRDA